MNKPVPVFAFGALTMVLGCSSEGGHERLGAATLAGVVENPNQIFGEVRFTNTNAAVVAILNTDGMHAGSITAVSAITSSTSLENVNADGTFADYELTVEATPPSGISYAVSAFALIAGDGGYFVGPPTTPLPVLVPPPGNPPVQVDFEECAGVVDVQWVSAGTLTPQAVNSANIAAFRADMGDPQSRRGFAGGTQVYLPVRGDGASYRVDIFYTTGTDPFSDTLTRFCQVTTPVGCDEIVPVLCEVSGDGGGDPLGRIIGNIDMLGQSEHRIFNLTLVQAFEGPFGNGRLDTVLTSPSQGAFELENLLASDETVLVSGRPFWYRVAGDLSFGLGRRTEIFHTPELSGGPPDPAIFNCTPPTNGHPNSRVCVADGQTVNLGNTFVMDPGFVAGDILLRGPSDDANSAAACLRDIYRDSDAEQDGDGIPDDFDPIIPSSRVTASGVDLLAPGATHTALLGGAAVLFEGEYEPLMDAFPGDYRITLGGLLGQSSIWRVPGMALRFLDPQSLALFQLGQLPTDPSTYQDSHIFIDDRLAPQHVVVPGTTLTQNIHRCFSKVTLNYTTTSGTFYNPRVLQSSGEFIGTDFEGNPADYETRIVHAQGTPPTQASAASSGSAVMCLPQASYRFNPWVTSVDPGGGLSDTGLPQVHTGPIGCGQDIVITPPIGVSLDLPQCANPDGSVAISGLVSSTDPTQPNLSFDTLTVSDDPEPAITLCSGSCTTPHAYATTFTGLEACENDIVVVATRQSLVSTASGKTSVDPTAPTLVGCDDISVASEAGLGGANVAFDVSASDNCPDSLRLRCDHASGSFFPDGDTLVTCIASDGCQQTECSFTVSVGACAEEPEIVVMAVAGDVAVCGATTDQQRVHFSAPSACSACAPAELTTIFDANFNGGTQGFVPADDLFRGTANPAFASETFTGSALEVRLGNNGNGGVFGMSGGWRRSFTLGQPANVSVQFIYDLSQAANYEVEELSQVVVSIDGVLRGLTPHDYVVQINGNGNGGGAITQAASIVLNLGPLGAGAHTFAIGAYNNKKTAFDEVTTLRIDDVALFADVCSNVPVNGQIVARNGVPLTPPLAIPASGFVDLTAGTYDVLWQASDAGLLSTLTQTVTVLAQALGSDPSCCPANTNVILGDNAPTVPDSDTLNGTPGRDCILGLTGNDTINGQGGDDIISGGDGEDEINGGPGNDIIEGGPGNDDDLSGGPGNDTINGGPGSDDLSGGPGNDTLSGGPGNDDLNGGSGTDSCNGGPGFDSILFCP